jgi:parallel beta-helix repeat protein
MKYPSKWPAARLVPGLFLLAALSACGGRGSQSSSPAAAPLATATDGAARALQPTATVQICAGHRADQTGQQPASDAIQACIDQIGPGGVLELPAGTYLMTSQLKIVFPFTLRTQGLAGTTLTCTDGADCATLKAAPAFSDRYGILFVGANGASVDRFVLDHVTLDGNRSARSSGAAHDACVSGIPGHNAFGFNATVQNCSSCKMVYSASVNALCGTGMSWAGNFATIEGNIFANNGDHQALSMWADGLSLQRADDSSIRNNRLTDNSDVGLISFGAARSSIAGNVVTQARAEAFAGLMLDSLSTGDFSDTSVADNAINCSPNKCFFGMNIGPGPWYPQNKPVFGGSITGNTIAGGTIGLNVSGAAAGTQAMHVGGNTLLGAWPGARVTCRHTGKVQGAAFALDPRSEITLGVNYLEKAPVNPVLQSTDNCIGS